MSIRVGIIGTGWGGQLHLEAARRTPEVEIVALCGRTADYGQTVARQYDVPHFYTDYQQMLKEADLDLLTIATPPPLHYEMTLAGIHHGCHVLCEKPMGMNATEAHELFLAAEENQVKHATGFIWRSDPSILALRKHLQEERIGAMREVQVRCALGTPPMPYTWLYDKAAGGGSLMQHGSHMIDRTRWILGAELEDVRGYATYTIREAQEVPHFHNVSEVFGWRPPQQENAPAYLPVTADTGYSIQATVKGTIPVSLWESWPAISEEHDTIEVYGTTGTLKWTGGAGLRLLLPRGRSETLAVSASGSGSGEEREVGHKLWQTLMQNFVADIQKREADPYPTFYDGWQVHNVIDAILS